MTMQDERNRVGNLIRDEMTKRSMSLSDLAYCAALDEAVISAYLLGKRESTGEELRTIAEVFEVTPAVFMATEDLLAVSDIAYGYRIAPIDYGFRYLRKVGEFRDLIRLEDLSHYEGVGRQLSPCKPLVLSGLARFDLNFEAAKRMARDLHWEGDFREGPFVMPVLVELEVGHAFVWKQDNNGSTFVLSPVPLPYLENL